MANTVCGISHDHYLPASFNGVPFYCVEASSEHGRRGAQGEFPFSESTAYADMGRRIRTYNLTAEFRDDNHIFQASALIAACEMPGPGVLVHPTRGIINAACKSIHVTDNMEEEAGITKVELEFVEGNAWPNGLSLVGSLIGLALGGIIGASSTSFTTRYNPKKVSPVYRTKVIDTAQTSVKLVADDYQKAIHSQNNIKKWRSLNELREVQNEDVFATDPKIMDKSLTLGMSALSIEIFEDEKFQTFKKYANWAAQPVKTPGLAADSEDAVYSHVRLLSAAYMAQASVETRYSRVDIALARLDSIVSILHEEALNARNRCDNELHLAIAQFTVETQTVLYRNSYDLPKLVEYDFHGGVHPLVAAYAIYNDGKKHRELELRNIVDANGRIGPRVIAASQPVKAMPVGAYR